MSVGKKTPLSLFSFSSSLNHKMPQRSPLAPLCVWHRSGRDTDTHPQRLLWSSSYQPPPRLFCGGGGHIFTESTQQKDASRKWSLQCRESRVARRYRWWKAFAKFNSGSEREGGGGVCVCAAISFQRYFGSLPPLMPLKWASLDNRKHIWFLKVASAWNSPLPPVT